MSVQMALLAPATRVASRKLGPTAGSRAERAGGLADEHVGEHVRKVGDAGHEAIVRVGVDCDGTCAEATQQPVQALVEDAGGGAFGGREVTGGALEQVLPGVLDAGGP